MKLEALVEKFAKDLELKGSLKGEVSGTFAIPVEENVSIHLTPLLPFGFELRVEFAECPKNNLESLYMELLHANLFGQGTGGARLGLNEQKDRLVLSQEIVQEITHETFNNLIEDFINTIDFWREELTHKT